MAVKFQLRRDTAANWAAENTILDIGEPGVETDTRKLKIGDGSTGWNALSYTIIQEFSELTNKPTTIAGYGITDAASSADAALAQTALQSGDLFDVQGSVFGDDSTILVDAVNNKLIGELIGTVSSLSNQTTTGLAEGTNEYFTQVRARGSVSVTDAGGDGSLGYDNGTGVITYTGPSAAETRAHFSNGTGVTITNGEVAIGQAVGTGNSVSFNNATLTGYLRGPASFVIDPAAHGDDTGTLVVAGNLQVDGTQTVINSTTINVGDKNILLGSAATADTQNNNAGITVKRPDDGNATLNWNETDDEWVFSHNLDVVGALEVSTDRAQHTTRITSPLFTGLAADGYVSIYGDEDATSGLYVKDDGFVGINSNDPGERFSLVDGNMQIVTNNNQGIYMGPSSNSYANFGSGVPTLHIQGTSAGNGRAGAIRFKENDDTDTGAIYSTNGADGYGGLVFASYQGSMRFSMGTLASNDVVLTQDGDLGIGNPTPTTRLDIAKSATTGSTGQYPGIRVNNTSTDLTGSNVSAADIQIQTENGAVQGQLASVSTSAGADRYVRLGALSNHRIQFMTNSAEVGTFSGNGNFGVGDFGATVPGLANGTNIEVKDGTIARLILNDTGGDKISIGNAANQLAIYNETDDSPIMVMNTEEHTITHTNFGFRIGTAATGSSFSATTMFDVNVPYGSGGTGIFGVIRLAVSLSGELGLNSAANRTQEATLTFSRTGANSGGGNTTAEFAIDLGSATSTEIGTPDIGGLTITVSVPAASAATQVCNVKIAGSANTSVIFRVKGAGQYMGDSGVTFTNLIN